MKRSGEVPSRIRVDRGEGQLELTWAGGIVDRLDLAEVRRLCPCALCQDLRGRQKRSSGLHMVTEAEMPSSDLSEIMPVGNYAIQIRWTDGHDTGIYTYDFLKQIGRETVS